jgi:hypothetical protein
MAIITTAGCQLRFLKSSSTREASVNCLPADLSFNLEHTHARAHTHSRTHVHTYTCTHARTISLSCLLSGTGVLILIVRGDVDTRPADQCRPAVASLSAPGRGSDFCDTPCDCARRIPLWCVRSALTAHPVFVFYVDHSGGLVN